jgi:hypothetical protein
MLLGQQWYESWQRELFKRCEKTRKQNLQDKIQTIYHDTTEDRLKRLSPHKGLPQTSD